MGGCQGYQGLDKHLPRTVRVDGDGRSPAGDHLEPGSLRGVGRRSARARSGGVVHAIRDHMYGSGAELATPRSALFPEGLAPEPQQSWHCESWPPLQCPRPAAAAMASIGVPFLCPQSRTRGAAMATMRTEAASPPQRRQGPQPYPLFLNQIHHGTSPLPCLDVLLLRTEPQTSPIPRLQPRLIRNQLD